MKRDMTRFKQGMMLVAMALAPELALAFNSGSTGADGAFSPTVNTQVQLPPSGVFNFTTVNIPVGVTVTFQKNATNTPVVILASGDVTVAGTIDLSGTSSTNSGAAGDGNLGDDGLPGAGGRGGYAGGRGGVGGASVRRGGDGLGPGGGASAGQFTSGACNTYPNAGGGGGFGTAGSPSSCDPSSPPAAGGPAYGSSQLLPLIGGSGGGGGSGGPTFSGTGGGGGGGAILIASSGTANITGTILSNGGTSGVAGGANFTCGAPGGGGSGGAIRIVATTISGNGNITAIGGTASGAGCFPSSGGGTGAVGRIRLESESITRTATTNPSFSFASPGPVFIAGFPTLAITSVAGVAAPAAPTGNADITLPSTTPNPVTVTFQTTGVPVGNTVKLTVLPTNAAPTTVVSPALTGTTDLATASVSVNLPSGPSVLQATTTYTIVVAMGEALSMYAQGERVEKITLAATLGGPSKVILVTVSGKEYEVAPAVLAAMGG